MRRKFRLYPVIYFTVANLNWSSGVLGIVFRSQSLIVAYEYYYNILSEYFFKFLFFFPHFPIQVTTAIIIYSYISIRGINPSSIWLRCVKNSSTCVALLRGHANARTMERARGLVRTIFSPHAFSDFHVVAFRNQLFSETRRENCSDSVREKKNQIKCKKKKYVLYAISKLILLRNVCSTFTDRVAYYDPVISVSNPHSKS